MRIKEAIKDFLTALDNFLSGNDDFDYEVELERLEKERRRRARLMKEGTYHLEDD